MPKFQLPSQNGVEALVANAGAQSITVSGLQEGSVLVEHWTGAAWATLVTLLPAVSGRIGATVATVNASKRVRCTYSGFTNPAHCNVFVQ
jgi:hypothetical protein